MVTLTATGGARVEWPRFQGEYTLTQRQHRGRPVYENSDGGRHLYSLETGAWAVGWVEARLPAMRSTDPAISPDLCTHWEYRPYKETGSDYQPGDISVTCKKDNKD